MEKYTYYKVNSYNLMEQRLTPAEIAEKYGVCMCKDYDGKTIAGHYYAKLIKDVITEYLKKDNCCTMEELYSIKSNILSPVFPKHVYEPAMLDFLKDYPVHGKAVEGYVSGINYNFVLKNRRNEL